MSSHIVAKTQAVFPEFQLWHTMGRASSGCVSLKLHVADQRPLAFASVEVYCAAPSELYQKRLLSLHTCPAEWGEDQRSGIAEAENEIAATLQEESRREDSGTMARVGADHRENR
jgi:hypothetical protein